MLPFLLLQEKQKLLDEIEDLTVQLTEEQEKKRKMGDKLSQERHQFQKEKESTQEVSRVGAACHSPVLLVPQIRAVWGSWPGQPLQKYSKLEHLVLPGQGKVQQLNRVTSASLLPALKFSRACLHLQTQRG